MEKLGIDGLDIGSDDDSWASVTIHGKTVRVDLYRAYNQFIIFDRQVREQYPDAPQVEERQVAYHDKICEYLNAIGFEGVGARAADKFDAALAKAVEDMGKADAAAQTPA